MVPARSHKVSRVSWYSGFRYANLTFAYGTFTLFGWSSQCHSASLISQIYGPNPRVHAPWFGLFRFRSPLLPKSHVVFFSSGYLDVSVHRVPGLNLWIQLRSTKVFLVRFPHSDIYGSMCICHYPQLFAAYHVFHRLLVPRHPPCALIASLKLFSDFSFEFLFGLKLILLTVFISGCYLSITSRMS